jgi:hypothetical protein
MRVQSGRARPPWSSGLMTATMQGRFICGPHVEDAVLISQGTDRSITHLLIRGLQAHSQATALSSSS